MANALLVYPEQPVTFWSFDEALKMIGKKSAFPPLGLLTIAGMMPDHYDLRLIDMNVEPLIDADLEWADVVVTSSMIIHWNSLEQVIQRCNEKQIPVMNGGPLPTQYHEEIEGDAVFYLGEAENGFMDVVDELVKEGPSEGRRYIDRRETFQSLNKTPLPRWDLISFSHYSSMVVQVTRGCPESCTFCNIPSLYGKTARVKTSSRVIQELDALYDAGWCGAVMAVDDNFVGNRKEIRQTLEEEVIPWQKERKYPLVFHTQASIRVSDDSDLLEAMHLAGFDKVFAGIESPVEESLKFMGARKNLQGSTSLLHKVKIIQEYGMEVQAGFIMGLDTDPDDIGDRMVAFIQEAGIPVAMVGILGVLRDTPDYKRYKRQGRLIEGVKYTGDSGIFSRQLSFVPVGDPDELLNQHRHAVETLNSPVKFFERCRTHYARRTRRPVNMMAIGLTEVMAFFKSLWHQGVRGSYRGEFWKFLAHMLRHHPGDFADGVRLAVQGNHLIMTTRQALQVDEVKTFLDEALMHLKQVSGDYKETFQRNVDSASRLMGELQDRLKLLEDDYHTLQQNADVLLQAAQEYQKHIRDEFQYQVREPLERFQQEIDTILADYAQQHGLQPAR
ncbi:MAG: DUF4070 domain-containing protein [Candidatus Latescibacteria bacterium]|nr:DUF4070 domain-containing protein [Candidatus Latescibacterota bacterium]